MYLCISCMYDKIGGMYISMIISPKIRVQYLTNHRYMYMTPILLTKTMMKSYAVFVVKFF